MRRLAAGACLFFIAGIAYPQQPHPRAPGTPPPVARPRVVPAPFGRLPDGAEIEGYTIRNPHGTFLHVITYGAIITSLRTRDRRGELDDIVLGFDQLDGYLKEHPYFGAIVGRYANRIAKGRFTLDGRTYQLPLNNGPNSLHGGTRGFAPVSGTPFDFRSPTAIGTRIAAVHQQLRFGLGYDHNFVLEGRGSGLIHAARVIEPASGRTLDVFTDQPGIQFYSGNFLDGSIRGKGDRVYAHRFGFCLETQHFPDSPNQPGFPSTILRPGERWVSRTVFRFGAAD